MDNGKVVSPGVHLTTIYQAKGREFDAVFVPGLIEGVLPRIYPELDSVAQEMELARSRRLLGVAMTRARRFLFLSSAEGRPSQLHL